MDFVFQVSPKSLALNHLLELETRVAEPDRFESRTNSIPEAQANAARNEFIQIFGEAACEMAKSFQTGSTPHNRERRGHCSFIVGIFQGPGWVLEPGPSFRPINPICPFPEVRVGVGSDDTYVRPVNVASVPMRSPFRYPGGKTWLIPQFRRWMRSLGRKPSVFVEPFAGGGSMALTAAFEDLADQTLMVELDVDVAAVWESVLGGEANWLARRILTFDFGPDSIASVLSLEDGSTRERAFRIVLRNRLASDGILAPGASQVRFGENGRGLRSRWYAKTLARRVMEIAQMALRIRFERGETFESLSRYESRPGTAFLLDPPYTAGGKRPGIRLYRHWEVDQARLFEAGSQLPGDFLMTCDDAPEIHALAARQGMEVRRRLMKGSTHRQMPELLIGRDLAWTESDRPLGRGRWSERGT